MYHISVGTFARIFCWHKTDSIPRVKLALRLLVSLQKKEQKAPRLSFLFYFATNCPLGKPVNFCQTSATPLLTLPAHLSPFLFGPKKCDYFFLFFLVRPLPTPPAQLSQRQGQPGTPPPAPSLPPPLPLPRPSLLPPPSIVRLTYRTHSIPRSAARPSLPPSLASHSTLPLAFS